jgi:hypothetical protein
MFTSYQSEGQVSSGLSHFHLHGSGQKCENFGGGTVAPELVPEGVSGDIHQEQVTSGVAPPSAFGQEKMVTVPSRVMLPMRLGFRRTLRLAELPALHPFLTATVDSLLPCLASLLHQTASYP